jgi:hypothetical protein
MTQLMTEGAIIGDRFGRVAIHAISHAGGYFLRQDILLIYGPVASGALQARFNVGRVTEEDKLWHPVYSHPSHFFFPSMRLCQLLRLGTVAHHRIVTDHALISGREPSLIPCCGASMALRAGQADGGMLLMAEGNRLWRDGEGQLLLFSLIDNRFLAQGDEAPQTRYQCCAKNYSEE